MQINNLNCCRPKRHINNFTGNYNSEDKQRMRRKHYEEMSDDVLKARSVVKAHYEVKHSPKGQLLNAMPKITTSLILTSLALTQPGKLSAKAAAGLGFLALFKGLDSTFDSSNKAVDKLFKKNETNKDNKKNKTAIKMATFALTSATLSLLAFVGVKSGKKIADKHFAPAIDFFKKEASTLAGEIDNTKLGKFFETKVAPFTEKHKKLTNIAKITAPFGILAGSLGTQVALMKSVSNDVKEKSINNYIKGKLIQQQAREDFEKIDAVEV